MAALTIGEIAGQSDCKVQTIRYYEQIGLLAPPARTAGNQRRYTQAHLRRLQFIRQARSLGFSLDDVRDLLSLRERPEEPCAKAHQLANTHLEEIQSKIDQLIRLQSQLQSIATICQGGKTAGDCGVMDALEPSRAIKAEAMILSSSPCPETTQDT